MHSQVLQLFLQTPIPTCLYVNHLEPPPLTGVYPHNYRDFGWTPHFKQAVLKDKKTFVELFKENGYKTLGTGKLLHKNVKKYWDEWGVPEGINYGPHAASGIDEKGKKIMGTLISS